VVAMAATATPQVVPGEQEKVQTTEGLEPGYMVICWDDPVNFQEYVTHVFQKVFGWPRAKAEHHMLEVHTKGKSLLIRTSLEKAEHYVHQLHRFGLQATMERAE